MKHTMRRDASTGRAKISHTGSNNEWRVVTTNAGPKGEFHHVQFRGQSWVHSPSLAAGIFACDQMSDAAFEKLPLADRQKIINVRRITSNYNPSSL